MTVGDPRAEARKGPSGDAAVERAARDHAALVYRVARAVLRNHHDAEDAAQEVFLRVLRFRRGLEGVENARTYLARIAYRVALDRRSRPRDLSLEDAAVSELPSGEAPADDRAAAEQVRALVAEKVAALPADLKHAVRLSTVGELTSPEIAEVLGIPEGTVRTRLMRARRILRIALAAALGLVLAAAGVFLRKREPGTETTGAPGISSKGEEGAGSAEATLPRPPSTAPSRVASPRLARAASTHPSKTIFFPSRGPLSEQEKLLVAYVNATAAPEAAEQAGFLDEPAPLPPLPTQQSDSPSLNP